LNIYFSASIRGGRQYLSTYRTIVSHLKSSGHSIATEHIVEENILEIEQRVDDTYIFRRDMELLDHSDAVISEVSNPSLGVGYEICYALEKRIETLCLYSTDAIVSAMILGNTSPHMHLGPYSMEGEMLSLIDEFMDNLK
jgi:hypothetical protein